MEKENSGAFPRFIIHSADVVESFFHCFWIWGIICAMDIVLIVDVEWDCLIRSGAIIL